MEICEDKPEVGSRVKMLKSNDAEGWGIVGKFGTIIEIKKNSYIIQIDDDEDWDWESTQDEFELVWQNK